MKDVNPRSRAIGLAVVLACVAGASGAAESNAVAVEALGKTGVKYLTTNEVAYPVDWSSGLVPAGATEAELKVTGNHYSGTTTVTPPATRIACQLFDAENGPFYNDSLKVSLNFKVNGIVRSALSTAYEVRKGSFARDRVLTTPTSGELWRTCRLPLDLPFDAAWFGRLPTYFATSNLVTGTVRKPVAPFTGASMEYGVVPLNRTLCGNSNRLNIKIWSADYRLADINLDGRPGMFVIVR